MSSFSDIRLKSVLLLITFFFHEGKLHPSFFSINPLQLPAKQYRISYFKPGILLFFFYPDIFKPPLSVLQYIISGIESFVIIVIPLYLKHKETQQFAMCSIAYSHVFEENVRAADKRLLFSLQMIPVHENLMLDLVLQGLFFFLWVFVCGCCFCLGGLRGQGGGV